jgi:toxin FitB
VRVLLDTCVLADLRDPRGHPAVKAAIALLADDDLYVSGLTLGEVARGVSLLTDGRKKRNLRAWLNGLQERFADRILAVDHETAELWGEIVARTQSAGYMLHVVEGLLAATALCRGLHIMTRTTPSFAATGALIVDPYADSATSQSL